VNSFQEIRPTSMISDLVTAPPLSIVFKSLQAKFLKRVPQVRLIGPTRMSSETRAAGISSRQKHNSPTPAIIKARACSIQG
jgi:hypothetical protein